MLEPLDDPDLEPSPYGHRGGIKNRAGDVDLRRQRHLVRNQIEDYSYLASFGLTHAEILRRLNLSEAEFEHVYQSSYVTGVRLSVNRQPTNDEREGWAWNCGVKGCTRCGGSH